MQFICEHNMLQVNIGKHNYLLFNSLNNIEKHITLILTKQIVQ